MSKLSRLRNAQRRIVKAQRRLWLAQLALWPTLVLTGVSAAAMAAVLIRRRRNDIPELPAAEDREPVNPATNGQLSHA